MRSWPLRFALLALLPAAGCVIDIGDDDGDGDGPCLADPIIRIELRNPETGQCQSVGGGGGGCPGDDAVAPAPPWAACASGCSDLDEARCLASGGCQAASVETFPSNADCIHSEPVFAGCWALAPITVPELPCSSLDAQSCSGRSDCSPDYENARGTPDPSIAWRFLGCAAEPSSQVCSGDADCAPGYECNLEDYCLPHPECRDPTGGGCPPVCYGLCVPETSACDRVDCPPGHRCEVVCTVEDPNAGCRPDPTGMDCAPPCEAICVPDGRPVGDCYAPVTCRQAPPACPEGTTPGIANGCYTGYCIPTHECGRDPGTCRGEVACDSLPPACPAGTVPGIRDGCWSGYCIPRDACEVDPCAGLMEPVCNARFDCQPVYEGIDCTCDAAGVCECRQHRYARCELRSP